MADAEAAAAGAGTPAKEASVTERQQRTRRSAVEVPTYDNQEAGALLAMHKDERETVKVRPCAKGPSDKRSLEERVGKDTLLGQRFFHQRGNKWWIVKATGNVFWPASKAGARDKPTAEVEVLYGHGETGTMQLDFKKYDVAERAYATSWFIIDEIVEGSIDWDAAAKTAAETEAAERAAEEEAEAKAAADEEVEVAEQAAADGDGGGGGAEKGGEADGKERKPARSADGAAAKEASAVKKRKVEGAAAAGKKASKEEQDAQDGGGAATPAASKHGRKRLRSSGGAAHSGSKHASSESRSHKKKLKSAAKDAAPEKRSGSASKSSKRKSASSSGSAAAAAAAQSDLRAAVERTKAAMVLALWQDGCDAPSEVKDAWADVLQAQMSTVLRGAAERGGHSRSRCS